MKIPLIYEGMETNYEVYEDGRIYDLVRERFVPTHLSNSGYLMFTFEHNGHRGPKTVHRMIATAFIPNPENKETVNHIDGNKLNNAVSNLEWATQSENNKHSFDAGLKKNPSGEDCHFAQYSNDQIERACQEMEKDQHSIDEISDMTGVPSKTLYEIRSGGIWQDIASKYTFPKNPTTASRIGLPYSTHKTIIDLIKEGRTNKEIRQKLGLQSSNKLTQMMSWNRRKFRNITNE